MSQNFYHVAELAVAAGVSARTIRYYISRGLIPSPTQLGRNAHYTEVHLDILKRIVQAQAEGKTLDQIFHIFATGTFHIPSPVPDPATVLRYEVAKDVSVEVKNCISPHRKRVIHHALAEFAKAVVMTGKDEE